MKNTYKFLALFLATFSLASAANVTAPTVYFNGDILTMEGDTPKYVEAVVVKDNKITYAGDMREAFSQAGSNAALQDLKGHTLLPGFIDTWGHFALIAQDTLGVNLAYFSRNPPQTRAQLINRLRSEAKVFNGWIIGTGYAEAMLSDGGLTIADLDVAFPNQAVLLENISTLTGMVNSAGLKKLGITKATKAVSGFIPVNPKTGQLTGELIGMPYLEAVAKAVGKYSQDLTFETYRKAEKIYVSNGFTTAQSYEASIADMRNMRLAIDRKIVAIDLIALPTFDVVDQMLATNPNFQFGVYSQGDRGFKVAGIQVPTDGAPQLRLAYFTKPYLDTTGFPKDWRGFAYYPQALFDKYTKLAYEKNIQYFGYSNGDAGIDMTLAALAKTISETGITEDRRTVIAHSFFARDDQLDDYKKKNIMAVMMPNDTWLYGDVYNKVLGGERAANLSPANSANAKGITLALHNDTPSSGPNVLFSVWSAVNRKTFSGAVLGPEQRITPYLALQGFTRNAAYQYKEELSKGSLAPGKLADLVVLDQNPLKVAPDDIKNIQVLKTIKGGVEVYSN
ncbi:amidohydrolase [Polynucleobacter sp. AP-Nickl1-40-C4]|uniref:amidohydrolase n=1 Tax=Polynucleobacter sp. AP-Nickl1-40-C4 TaxID=3108275 RepID=UPI002B225781|nr:amidohydrolase family protein [Polynucleobacter sp. AP-Nickl1-40-C4]MEA9567165.1 amidohydrolase family protein [Polynucleobacter sp. AP-Nickl1-40-C4]